MHDCPNLVSLPRYFLSISIYELLSSMWELYCKAWICSMRSYVSLRGFTALVSFQVSLAVAIVCKIIIMCSYHCCRHWTRGGVVSDSPIQIRHHMWSSPSHHSGWFCAMTECASKRVSKWPFCVSSQPWLGILHSAPKHFTDDNDRCPISNDWMPHYLRMG